MKYLLSVILVLLTLDSVAHIVITPVHSISDIPENAPQPGQYRLHLIDVGTGLSVFVQGHNWNLLFDAGSADDKSGNQSSGDSKSRVIAYLYKAIGPSGERKCKPDGDNWNVQAPGEQLIINHLFQSHPHEDHGVMLDDVLECYQVEHIWDSGAINDTVFYKKFIQRVSEESGAIYNTAIEPPQNKTIRIKQTDIQIPNTMIWQTFEEGQVVYLDEDNNDYFTILHADGSQHSDPNENSIVIRLDLGSKSVLLTGDAGSGARKLPTAALGDIEKHLVDYYNLLINVDILQVGHHGSKTSSRAEFIEIVSPEIALISSGPKKYQTVVLPDPEIVEYLESEGIQILRTNLHDDGCPIQDRIGRDNNNPGGCSSYILEW